MSILIWDENQERQRFFKLPTWAYRKWRGDTIEMYEIMKNLYDKAAAPFMKLWTEMEYS